jgi:secreted Zn-dependent insulinase-like peptidase
MKLYTNDNQFSSTTQGRLFVEVWNQCLTEVTREFTYMADCAGLSFSSHMYSDNVGFEWSGYNSSLPVFIKETIDILQGMKSQDLEAIFETKKEELL